jgi:hypothetical protein
MATAQLPSILGNLEQYVKSCEEEVLQTTGIRFKDLDIETRPILEFSFAIEGWTHGKLNCTKSFCVFHVGNELITLSYTQSV